MTEPKTMAGPDRVILTIESQLDVMEKVPRMFASHLETLESLTLTLLGLLEFVYDPDPVGGPRRLQLEWSDFLTSQGINKGPPLTFAEHLLRSQDHDEARWILMASELAAFRVHLRLLRGG